MFQNDDEKYRFLFENMAQGVFYQSADGIIIDVNPATLEIFGLSRDEFLGRTSTAPQWKVICEDGSDLPGDQHPSMIALKTGKPVLNKLAGVFNPQKNNYTWIIINAIPQFRTDEDTPYQVLVTIHDISDQKKLQKKLELQKREVQHSLDALTDGIWHWNLETNQLRLSNKNYEMLGYAPGEFDINYENLKNLIHPEDFNSALETTENYLKIKTGDYENEVRLRSKQGDFLLVHAKGKIIECDAQGNAILIIGSLEDITERRQANLALVKSEQKWRNILVNTPQLGIALNPEATIVFANPHFLKLTGWQEHEVIGHDWFELFIPKHFRQDVRMVFNHVMKEKDILGFSSYENEIMTKGGELRNVAWSNAVTKDARGNITDVTCLGIDLTERKNHEMKLQESEAKYRLLVENQTDMVVKVDLEGRFLFVSQSYCKIFGKKEDELIGKKFMPVVHEEDRAPTAKAMEALYSPPHTAYMEQRCMTKDGWQWIAWEDMAVLDNNGKVKEIIGVGRNINDRKLSENMMRRSEALLNATQQIAMVGGWEWDVENKSMFWTDEAYRIQDFNPEHYGSDSIALIKKGLECYDPEDRPFIMNAFQKCAEQGKSYDIEFPFTTATGRRIWIRTIAKPVLKDDKIIRVVGNIMDVSARKQAELSLQNANEELEKKVQQRTKELLKANKLLESEIEERKKAEKQLIQSHEQLHDLTRHLQSSKEQERIHIAREIHDDLGQNLTAIKMNMSWIAAKIDQNQEQLTRKASATIDLTDQTIRTVRKIVSELRPGLLDELGLIAAIEWHAEEFRNHTGIQVKLEIDPPEINLHAALSTTIFRIFQECMTNVAKHSQAADATVTLTEKDTLITLTVSDNGIGFIEKNASDRNSFGILGIKERVLIFDGEMDIDSLPGKGTTVRVAIDSSQGFE